MPHENRASDWDSLPYHPIKRASLILGCSAARIYDYLRREHLVAVRLGGKTLVDTKSMVALLDSAEPWSPATYRVDKANAARRTRMKTDSAATTAGA